MNNGRYWTLMDHGRADIMIRSGLWRAILKRGWVPVVSAGQIRFRREMKLFQPFTLETRILTWSDGHVVMEHRLLSKAREGALCSIPSRLSGQGSTTGARSASSP